MKAWLYDKAIRVLYRGRCHVDRWIDWLEWREPRHVAERAYQAERGRRIQKALDAARRVYG